MYALPALSPALPGIMKPSGRRFGGYSRKEIAYAFRAAIVWRALDMQRVRRLMIRALLSAGSMIAMSTMRIATTTSNSINVKAARRQRWQRPALVVERSECAARLRPAMFLRP